MIILNTIKGKGAAFCEGKVGSHNMPVTKDMAKEAIEGLE
jgi:transketolase